MVYGLGCIEVYALSFRSRRWGSRSQGSGDRVEGSRFTSWGLDGNGSHPELRLTIKRSSGGSPSTFRNSNQKWPGRVPLAPSPGEATVVIPAMGDTTAVCGLRFGVWGLGFEFLGVVLGFGVRGLEFGVWGL